MLICLAFCMCIGYSLLIKKSDNIKYKKIEKFFINVFTFVILSYKIEYNEIHKNKQAAYI